MTESSSPRTQPKKADWLSRVTWGVAVLMTALLVFVLMRRFTVASSASIPQGGQALAGESQPAQAALPDFQPASSSNAIFRFADLRTIIPTRARTTAEEHTVELGDSIFGIARDFNLKPESVLWANYATLKDNPDLISVGIKLIIPPADGVYYQWKESDKLAAVAAQFKVKPIDILTWPGNHLDITNPVIQPGAYVMIPGGKREYQRQWLVGTIPRGAAGVNVTIEGMCDSSAGTAVGSGAFMWPAATNVISGNDFWDGHLGIDIGAGEGMEIWASDSGVVVFAGGSSGGYGRMIMIDHGDGYQTLYAHLSVISIRCGQNVVRGQVIGLAGSTGNSTGAHLHFEVRYLGTFINPHYVLP